MTIKINYPLPFYIPLESGPSGVHNFSDFMSIKFRCEHVPFASDSEKKMRTTIYVELIPETNTSEWTIENILSFSVQNSIIYLNNFIDAFRLVKGCNYVKNFNVTDLPLFLYIEVDSEKYPYVTISTTILDSSPEMNSIGMGKTVSKMALWFNHEYFEVVDKFLSRATHHLYTEEFVFAIIELQTSFESYIRLCHNLILRKQGASDDIIERAKTFAFKNTITDHIGPALEENLQFNSNPIIQNWESKLYKLRNGIVHSGNSYINGDSAYEAFDAYREVTNYITILMVKKGFMEENGQILVSSLNKNTPSDVDKETVLKRLKEQGLI
jgi:hypothetical protein